MGAVGKQHVRSPRWTLFYQGTNITDRVSKMVISITYTDELSALADELEVEFEDRDRRWQGPWFPTEGDRANLQIGYEGETSLNAGDFRVDEVELTGPPDVVRMRCLSAYITENLRESRSVAYESVRLVEIAEQIGARHGYTVFGLPHELDVKFERITQHAETDLGFLQRLASQHDYDFHVRGSRLEFVARPALEARPPDSKVSRTEVEKFSFKSRTRLIYRAAEVSYFNPDTKRLVVGRVEAERPTTKADTLKLAGMRVENAGQAMLKAAGALKEENRFVRQGNLVLPGTIELRAGNNVQIGGFGVYDAKYQILRAHHRLDRQSGYTTEIEVRIVA